MPRTLRKSKLYYNKHKPIIKQEPNKTKSNLPPNPQSLKQKLYQETALLNINSLTYYE